MIDHVPYAEDYEAYNDAHSEERAFPTEETIRDKLYWNGFYLFRKRLPIGVEDNRLVYVTRYSILDLRTMHTVAGECMKLEEVMAFGAQFL